MKTSIALAAVLLAFAAQAQQPAQPDPQMKAMLDKLATLGGKPIETLSPEEACKQPTPADAVMKLMKDQGKKPGSSWQYRYTSIAVGDQACRRGLEGSLGEAIIHFVVDDRSGVWRV